MSYKVVKINNVYKVPKMNNVYKVVYEAEVPPAPTPIGDAYTATYNGSSWSSYTLKTDNDISTGPTKIRLFSSDDSYYRLPWNGTGNLEFEIKVNLPTGLSSVSNYILYANYFDGSGTWSCGIHLNGYNVKLPPTNANTRTLTTNTNYLLKVSLNVANNTQSLYVKEIGVDSDYVLVQTYPESKYSGGTSSFISLYNYGGSAPYTLRPPVNLEDIKVTANGTILFQR